jgi:tetratricopeptide (TPR) repeat protein
VGSRGAKLERAIADARTADERGETARAIAFARDAVAHASTLGDPYLARAYLELGDRLVDSDVAAAERAYRDALAATERASLDVMRVDAMLQLMKALARQPGRERELFDLAPLITAAAERAGRDNKAAPHVYRLLGVAHDRLGEHDEAIRDLQTALALARERHKNPFDTRMIKYLMTLAEVLDRAGKSDDAIAYVDEAVRVSTNAQGIDHIETRKLIDVRATMRAPSKRYAAVP